MISTLDSDDDTKLSKTEFLAAADLVHAMLQVREKEDNIDFITKVHQFSIKELKAAICQAKVLLEPRVKQLQAMAAAAKYQLKHSTRILCKQKCLLHKTSVMRAEISAARRAEREEEEQRQEREEEAKHAARCQSMAAEIEQKRRERAACLEAADLKTRPDGEGGYSKPFRRMAKERALLLAAEVEDAGKNKDLDLYLKMMKIATRWRQLSVDTAFGAWHENTKSVGGWKNRTPFRDRLINIAASMALKAQEELQGKVHAAAAGERRRQEVQMKQLFARKRSALARWHAKQSARQRQQEEEAEAEICARAQKRQQEREAKEMWQRDREKWIESMTLQQGVCLYSSPMSCASERAQIPCIRRVDMCIMFREFLPSPPNLVGSSVISNLGCAARDWDDPSNDPSKGRHGDALALVMRRPLLGSSHVCPCSGRRRPEQGQTWRRTFEGVPAAGGQEGLEPEECERVARGSGGGDGHSSSSKGAAQV